MMKTPMFFFFVIVLVLASAVDISAAAAGGAPSCKLSDIVIEQTKTGSVVEGKQEYLVTVSNNCHCSQSQVVVKCFGMSSVEPVDPHVLRPVDDVNCILHDGLALAGGSPPITFKYAWLTPQDFPLVSSHIDC